VEHGDKLVRRCIAVYGGHDILGNRVEDGGILLKDVDVEYLLGIAEAEMLELGVETGALGAEVWNAERGGDASTGEKDDVGAPTDEVDGVVDGVVP
jgi:hypothetical protein